MKFLIDAQLPPHLKAIFENNFDKLLKLINYKDLVIVGIDKIDIQF